MPTVSTGNLSFEINETGNKVKWFSLKHPIQSNENGDFWRLYVDDGKYRDCPVYSHLQKGIVDQTDDHSLSIIYSVITDSIGRKISASIKIRIFTDNQSMLFTATVENHDERFRLNEIKLPFMDMTCLCSQNRQLDTLIRPNGLGEKCPDPWSIGKTTSRIASNREYLEPTQNEFFDRIMYPGHASMGWMGVETSNCFLYLAQHDQLFRTCDLTFGVHTSTYLPSLILEITHFPVLKYGETEEIAPTVVALFDGDWRKGGQFYRQWADATWWETPKSPSWMKNMTGREKVILRHGNGQILHTYDEIPAIMKKAMECGLTFLEVYGWHSGGQDNDYPNYIPDPEQGGEEGLRKAIDEVHKMGGRICLYGQGELLDTWNDYFRQKGYGICRKNIMHEPYYCFFNYSSGGSLLRRFHCNITHTTACQATDEWNRVMREETIKFLNYGADGVFWDMEGGPTPVICFDETHLHKTRGDREALWRSKNIRDVHDICLAEDHSSGIEFPVDCLSKDADYTMGCWSLTPHPFYEMFRATFPEIVVTNRWCDDENDGYISALNEDFLYGLRWNICMFRTRGTLYDVPNYAEYLKKLTKLQLEYAKYLLQGYFCVDHPIQVPDKIRYAEYRAKDDCKKHLYVLWNTSSDIRGFDVLGKPVVMQPNSVQCIECCIE